MKNLIMPSSSVWMERLIDAKQNEQRSIRNRTVGKPSKSLTAQNPARLAQNLIHNALICLV